jgi:hypothetical protein
MHKVGMAALRGDQHVARNGAKCGVGIFGIKLVRRGWCTQKAESLERRFTPGWQGNNPVEDLARSLM